MGEQKPKVAIFHDDVDWIPGGHVFDKVYANSFGALKALADFYPVRITSDNLEEHLDSLSDVEAIFSTWMMPVLTETQVEKLVSLKIVFYGAGATNHFRDVFEKRGITVSGASPANAVPVAEFALGQVLLAGAGYFRSVRESTCNEAMQGRNSYRGHGNYGKRVAILGNGAISNKLQNFLSSHTLDVVVVPSRVENRATSLEEAFETSFAVVNLFPDRDDNVGVFNKDLFRRMIDGAVFINVGRGRQVNENDLVTVFKERSDLTALLDVQYPEPPEDGSALFQLPNILLSAHIAGSKAAELMRMGDYMLQDFKRYLNDEPLQYRVMPGQL